MKRRGTKKLEQFKSLSLQGLFQQFIVFDYCMQSPALFQNIFKLFFAQTFIDFALFQHFFTIFLKNCTHALNFQNRPWVENTRNKMSKNVAITQKKRKQMLDKYIYIYIKGINPHKLPLLLALQVNQLFSVMFQLQKILPFVDDCR